MPRRNSKNPLGVPVSRTAHPSGGPKLTLETLGNKMFKSFKVAFAEKRKVSLDKGLRARVNFARKLHRAFADLDRLAAIEDRSASPSPPRPPPAVKSKKVSPAYARRLQRRKEARTVEVSSRPSADPVVRLNTEFAAAVKAGVGLNANQLSCLAFMVSWNLKELERKVGVLEGALAAKQVAPSTAPGPRAPQVRLHLDSFRFLEGHTLYPAFTTVRGLNVVRTLQDLTTMLPSLPKDGEYYVLTRDQINGLWMPPAPVPSSVVRPISGDPAGLSGPGTSYPKLVTSAPLPANPPAPTPTY